MDSLLCDEVWLCSPLTTATPSTTTTSSTSSYPGCCNDGNCCDSACCINSITKEECQQSLAMFMDKEATYMPPQPAAYLHRLCRSTSLSFARSTAIQWLVKSCSRLNLSVSTVFSASNCLDRFMSTHRTLEWETWMVELVTIACLSVASKFNETNAPSLYDFQMEEMEYCFQPITIQQMELLLLQSLQWRLASTTCHSYVELLILSIATDDSSSSTLIPKLHLELSATATRFLVGSLLECKFVEYRPSSVAISAVWCSLEELASSNPHYSNLTADIIPKLLDNSIHKDDVINCHGLMMKMEMEMDCSSSRSPVTVLCRAGGVGVDNRDDFHVDLSVFRGSVGGGLKLGSKKKRKWKDL